MKHQLLISLLLLSCIYTQAQSDAAIKQVIDIMFDGMVKADSAKVKSTLDKN